MDRMEAELEAELSRLQLQRASDVDADKQPVSGSDGDDVIPFAAQLS
jgi:hypothetical protein